MSDFEFSFIDLFAGIGGFHRALHDIGGQCVFASEQDKYARKTYEANYRKYCPDVFDTPGLYNDDITQLDPAIVPNFDVLCAGFPCQPFSMAGHKKGFEDARGTLFFDIARLIKYKQEDGAPPKVILLENVKHFKHHDKGRTLEVIKNVLTQDLGYKFTFDVLNSRNFGLPQNRARVFMVAWLPELAPSFKFPNPESPEAIRVGDILEDNVDDKYTISNKLWEGHQRRKKEHLKKGNGFGYSLFKPEDDYTSTISARYYKDGSEILIYQDGKNPRKLSPREAANLQGFPSEPEFIIPVSDTRAYKQFGNAVSVNVVRAVGIAIKEQILSNANKLS